MSCNTCSIYTEDSETAQLCSCRSVVTRANLMTRERRILQYRFWEFPNSAIQCHAWQYDSVLPFPNGPSPICIQQYLWLRSVPLAKVSTMYFVCQQSWHLPSFDKLVAYASYWAVGQNNICCIGQYIAVQSGFTCRSLNAAVLWMLTSSEYG